MELSKLYEKSDSKKVLVLKEDTVGWIIFNNVKRHNALSLDMWQALPNILENFSKDPDIRVVVLKGAGEKAFISGADISEFEKKRKNSESVAHYDKVSLNSTECLRTFSKPTIAKIHGYCIGGGLAMALSCDIRIASADARFAIPAAKLGLGYRLSGLIPLVELVGPAFAKEIIITGRHFDSSEALQMGLINRVVPRHNLDEYVSSYIKDISENAPLTISAAKYAISEMTRKKTDFNHEVCDSLVEKCFESNDYNEGRLAFMEKRKPIFRGL